jgi:Phage gp6-like head-tail connector protein
VSLTVTTKSDSTALVDLATVKARLRITDSSRDAVLSDMIDGVSDNITDYLGFPLARQTYLETIEGKGRPRLILTARPVDRDSISVTVNGIAFTGYALEKGRILFRPFGWPGKYWESSFETATDLTGSPIPAGFFGPSSGLFDGQENVSIAYSAGYLLPGQVETWQSAHSLPLGAWIRPSRPSLSPWLFQVATAGSTGSIEPIWPTSSTSSGQSVTDGAAVLVARDAQELPAVLKKAAALAVLYDFEQRPAGLTSQGVDSYRESYDPRSQGDLPPHVCKILDRWRSDF